MYLIGEFVHDAYRDFLKNLSQQSIPLEQYLYVRSSGSARCLESAQLFASAFTKEDSSIDNINNSNILESSYDQLTKYWRPIPIHSIEPEGSDAMLDAITSTVQCPNAESEFEAMQYKSTPMQRILNDNAEFLKEISLYAGQPISSLLSAYELYQELYIERQYDYHWWKYPYQIWTEDYETYAVSKLRELSRLYWSVQWDNK